MGVKIYSPKKRKIVFSWGKESKIPEPETDKPEAEEDIPQGGVTAEIIGRVPDPKWNPGEYIKMWAGQNTVAAKKITEARNQLVQEGKLPGIKFADLTRQQCDEMLEAVKTRLSA